MASYSIQEYDFSQSEWIGGSEGKLATFAKMRDYPHDKLDPVLFAVRNGATFPQAAMAGGLTPGELEKIIQWGMQGHPAFEKFRDDMLVADYESVSGAMAKLKEKADSGDTRAFDKYMKMKSKEYRILHGEQPGQEGEQQASLSGINIQINTGFGETPRLASDNDIDAEAVEEL